MKIFNQTYKQFIFFQLALLLILPQGSYASDKHTEIDFLLAVSQHLQFTDHDLAVINFQTCLSYYESVADTNKILETCIVLIGKYSGMGKYQLAYDCAWSILPLIEKPGFAKQKVEVYRSIAILYTIFEQYEKANYYLDQSISNAENLVMDEIQKHLLLSKLYSSKAWLVKESTEDLLAAEKWRIKSIENSKQDENSINLRFQRMHLA